MTTEKQYINLDNLKQYLIMEEGGDKIYWNGGVFWALTFKDEFKPKSETGKKDTASTGGDSSSGEVETSSMSHSKIRPLSERIHYFTVDEKKNNKKKKNNNNGNDNASNVSDILKQIRAENEREMAEWRAEIERERAERNAKQDAEKAANDAQVNDLKNQLDAMNKLLNQLKREREAEKDAKTIVGKKGTFSYYCAIRKDNSNQAEFLKDLGNANTDSLLKKTFDALNAKYPLKTTKEFGKLTDYFQYNDLYDLYYASYTFSISNTKTDDTSTQKEDEELEAEIRNCTSIVESTINEFMKTKKMYVQAQIKSSNSSTGTFSEATRYIKQMVDNPSQFTGYSEFKGAWEQMKNMGFKDFMKRYGTKGDFLTNVAVKGLQTLFKKLGNKK